MIKHRDGAVDQQLKTLLDTVEQIRITRYPEVPADFVKHVLLQHSDAAVTELDIVRDLEKFVDEILKGSER